MPAHPTDEQPLSPEQHALWLLRQLEPEGTAYHISVGARLHGALDVGSLRGALEGVVDRHPALRTTYAERDGRVVQRVAPRGELSVELSVEDAASLDDAGLASRMAALAAQPFDLERGPVMRAALLRRSGVDHGLLVCVHHIAADLASMDVIAHETNALYHAAREGSAPPRPPRGTHLDYVRRQAENLAAASEALGLRASQALRDVPFDIRMPTDRALLPAGARRGAVSHLVLDGALRGRLIALARSRKVTLYTLLLAAWQAFLRRVSHQERFVVGSPSTGRDRPSLASVVGYFVNLVAIPADLREDPVFDRHLERVASRAREALERRDLPFPWVLDRIRRDRGEPRPPRLATTLSLERPRHAWIAPLAIGLPGRSVDLLGTRAEAVAVPAGAQVDLRLTAVDDGRELLCALDYDPDLFDAATIEALGASLRALLEGIVDDPSLRVSRLPLLSPAERRRALVEWNDTARPYDDRACLHQLFAAQAARSPEAAAVVTRDRSVSYAELEGRANRIAHRLVELGARPGDRVAVCLERSAELVAAILGTLKAGAAYLPLDPRHPADRRAFVVEDARARVLVTAGRLAGRLPLGAIPTLRLDEDDLAALPGSAPGIAVDSAAPAYVLYTSGTTGRPKGIVCAHRGVVSLLEDIDRRAPIGAGDAASLFSSIGFDVSVWELFAALRVGAALHRVPDEARADGAELAAWIERCELRSAYVPAGLLGDLARVIASRGTPLRRLLVGAEPIPLRQLASIARAAPGLRVLNGYGPTETTIVSTIQEIHAGPLEGPESLRAPIGRPVQNTRIYLLDPKGEPVPVGVTGEIHIGGIGLAHGYHERPELTAERFLADPFGPPGERLYRTGDQARRLPDGALEFVGRLDQQVKIRGHRVEPGEIESALAEHEGVLEAAVIARNDGPRGLGLVAYVGAAPSRPPEAAALRAFLVGRVPSYMVPSRFVVLPALPRNASGKVDRAGLPPPPDEPAPHEGDAAPRDHVEEVIAGIWRGVLGAPRVGARDDFFALGGHSLLAAQVVNRLRASLGVELPIRAIFEAPTLEELAAVVRGLPRAPTLEARETPSAPRAPAPISFAQERLWFLDRIESGSRAYVIAGGVRARGRLVRSALQAALTEVVRRHEALRSCFPEVDGAPILRLLPAEPVPLPWHDLTRLTEADREGELLRLAEEHARAPFDLARGPLLRASLIGLGNEEHALLLAVHHIVADGWSLSILVSELAALHDAFARGEASPLPPLPAQLADHARREREELAGGRLERGLEFWRATLRDLPSPLELPSDGMRSAGEAPAGRASVTLEAGLTRSLLALCHARGATPFMLLLAALDLLLFRLSGQGDLVVGTPVATRDRVDAEGLIGLFLNTLALRVRLDASLPFTALLERAREATLAAHAHGDVPFERLVADLNPERDLRRTPLFDVLLNFVGVPTPLATAGGVVWEPVHLGDLPAKYALTLYASVSGGRLALDLVHRRDLYSSERAAAMRDQLEHLLAQIAADPTRAVGDYSLVTPGAPLPDPRARLDAETHAPLPELLLASPPEGVALRHRGRDLSHRELAASSTRIARALLAGGLAPGEAVALLAERGFGLVAAMIGILAAGGVLLLLDPDHPPARWRAQIDRARARRVVRVGASPRPPGAELLEPDAVLSIGDDGELPTEPPPHPLPRLSPASPAYVFFTSGTTGTPRAVLGLHRGLSHFIAWQRDAFGVGPLDRAAQLTGVSFDVILRDVFTPLVAGATLCIPDDRYAVASGAALLPWLEREGITLLHTVPTLAASWLQDPPAGASLRALRLVFFAGEPLGEALVRRFCEAFPEAPTRLVNLYGPTETTLAKCFHVVSEPTPGVQPVGRPMPGAQALVLRGDAPCGVGETGEIVLRTPFRTAGYLDDPGETARRFVPNPLAGDAEDLVYRTGDLGRFLPDGALEIRGRLDHQVKIGGVRVEPAEVAAVLSRHPGVHACAVVAVKDPRGEVALCAYVVAAAPAPTPEALAAHAAGALPAAMIPRLFVYLDRLPTTPNGKLDRRALPPPDAPSASRAHRAERVPPRTALERTLVEIWARVLGREGIGVRDDFFALGGHSLVAMRLQAETSRVLGLDASVRALFENPTIEGLAAALAAAGQPGSPADEPPALLPAPEARGEPFPLTDVQAAFLLGRSEDFTLGGTATQGYAELDVPALDVARLEEALRRLVARHDMLRSVILPDGRQQILDEAPFAVEIRDLRALGRLDVERALQATRDELEAKPLPPDRAPLLAVSASLLPGGATRVHVRVDSLVMDAWSARVLARELASLLAEPTLALPPLHISFRDFVLAQIAARGSDATRRDRDYWRERVATLPPAPDLPLAVAPASIARPRFRRRRGRLDAAAWEALRRRAAARGLTPSSALLTAYAEVLALFARSPCFTLNLTTYNRDAAHPQVNDLVGNFSALTLLEVDHGAAEPVEARARRLSARLWRDLERSRFTGVEVLRELAREGRDAMMPYVFTSALGMPGAEGGPRLPDPVHAVTQSYQALLNHGVSEDEGALELRWDAVEEAFPAGLLDGMFEVHGRLVRALAAGDEAWRATGARAHLDASEGALAERANATSAPVSGALLHELFEEQAALRPEHPAIVDGRRAIGYGELLLRAQAVAGRLRAAGAGPDRLCAIVMEKGWEQVVAALGVVCAGAAYLPIDPSLPAERVRCLLRNGEVTSALTQSWLDARVDWPEGVSRVLVDEVDPRARPAHAGPRSDPADLAYVIYTSGSTGEPKGVMIDHRGAVNTVLDVNRRFGVCPEDRVLALSSLSFDLSVYDIFGALAAGATIVVPAPGAARDPAEVAACVAEHGVTIWSSVPALLELLVDHAEQGDASVAAGLGAIRLALLSGDWIPVTLPDRLRRVIPGARVVSLGGATEASIWSILYPIGAVDPSWKSVPYGLPMANQTMHVLDHSLEPRPTWAVGELFIGGVGVARGYWRDETRTRARFILHPGLGRLYRTGDLGRRLPDGNIEFLGRDDGQVKVRGHRIELGEVDAALVRHPAVREAVTVARGEGRDRRLVAYLVPRDAEERPTELVRGGLAARLPAYMIPADLVWLPELPLTANGKVDRARLPAPEVVRGRVGRASPRTIAEGALASLLGEVLGVRDVAPDDDFLALGGDSILAVQAVARARRAGIHLTVRRLLDRATVAELAALPGAPTASLEAAEGRPEGERPLTPVQRWFFEHGFEEPHHWNQALVVGVRPDVGADAIRRAVGAVVEHHDALRLRFTLGPEGWRQRYAPPDGDAPFDHEDLSALPDHEHAAATARIAAERQASLDLEHGPLLRATLLSRGGGRPGRLLIVIHHLVVDGVSWRVLAEDLCALLEGGGLPPRTASFGQWAERLVEHARSASRAEELPRWLALPWSRARPLPVDHAGAENRMASARRREVVFTPEETEALLRDAPAACGARIEDVLLAALVDALSSWTGAPAVLVDREGHGRSLLPELDVSRTVGWFTSISPLLLERPEDARTPGGLLRSVIDQVRSHPDVGPGFGLLRYLGAPEGAARLAALPRPEISFDYLGQADPVLPAGAPLAWTGEDAGPTRSPRARRRDLLEVIGGVSGGRLRVTFTHGDPHAPATIERLACAFAEAVRAMLGSIEEELPVTPLAGAMLAEADHPTREGAYHVQIAFELEGPLDLDALSSAWRRVVDRQDALRSTFVRAAGGPWRLRVQRAVTTQVDALDLRDLAPDERLVAWERILEADRARSFDLDRPPLARLTVAQTGEVERRVLFSHHHLVLDGWSQGIFFDQLFRAYEASVDGRAFDPPPAPRYGELLRWLGRRDVSAAADLLRASLDDVGPQTLRLPATSAGSPKPARQDPGGGSQGAALSVEETAALGALARAHRWTQSVLAIAAWALAMTGPGDDVLVGMTVAGRPAELHGVESAVGLYIDVVPVRLRVPRGASVAEYVRRVRDRHAALLSVEHTPLELARRVGLLAPGASLLQTNLRFQNFPMEASLPEGLRLAHGGRRLDASSLRASDTWHFPLNVVVVPGSPRDARLHVRLDYARDRLDDATAGDALRRFMAILGRLPRAAEGSVGDLLVGAASPPGGSWA